MIGFIVLLVGGFFAGSQWEDWAMKDKLPALEKAPSLAWKTKQTYVKRLMQCGILKIKKSGLFGCSGF